MRVFFSALQGVLEIVIIIAIGYLLTHKRWFEEKTADLFAKIVLNLSLPLGMIVNISSFFTKNDLINSAKGLIIPFLSILISYFLGYFLALIFKTKKGRRGLLAGIF
ncbi:MAG: AEC family transporter, partial [Dictyoglomus thermophilum]